MGFFLLQETEETMEITIVRMDGEVNTHTMSVGEVSPSHIKRIIERGQKVKPISTISIRGANFVVVYVHDGVKSSLCMVEKLFPPFCSRIFYNDGKFDRSIFFGSKELLDKGEYIMMRHPEIDPRLPAGLESVGEVLMYAQDMTHYFSVPKRSTQSEQDTQS